MSRLSDQLYTKSTHFLLELLQNCDDNTYASDVIPQVTFVYQSDGLFFLVNNEVGFQPDHIDAICRVGRSTKRASKGDDGFIGEKGIGFKSLSFYRRHWHL